MAIGSISLIVNILLKLIPIGKNVEHQEEGRNKVGEMRRKTVLSAKRIEEKVERDLAKNNPCAW